MTVNLQGPDPLRPASIHQLAEGFFLAGGRCLLDIPVAPGLTQCLVSPAVVNLCLSIELFCKALILAATHQPAPKTHRLTELITLLPPDLTSALEAGYRAEVPAPTLQVLVEQVSDYFVKVRYGHEFGVVFLAEYPIFVVAKTLYAISAREHGIKVGAERIRV